MQSTGALFLVDDSAENALEAANSDPPVKVLLFGDYPWNAIVHRPETQETMTYVEQARRGLLEETEQRRQQLIREGWLPDGVIRVANWDGVIQWIENYKESIR